ncbi:hypothetical protein JAO78_005290 [Alishewanella sp. 16-MA]|uniref:Uncharacterized protein n=1 Tax=Alishewanella maricola TaxID=2795740 RepID=A0ABS8C1M5_9ALTE|nr:phage regulatory CII family protein [Alishewanella maricola]MCB5226226.1 hypothetical protein [Alishewanella maricola]
MTKHTLKPFSYSCPIIAAYQLGHSYGVDRFASETYQNVGSMYNKLNPENDSNHLYLRDAILLTEKANNDAILSAWAQQRGGVFVKLPNNLSCEEELSDQLLRLSEEMGLTSGGIRESRSDGIIDPDEYEGIEARIDALVTEALALKALIKSQVRDLPKPVSAEEDWGLPGKAATPIRKGA